MSFKQLIQLAALAGLIIPGLHIEAKPIDLKRPHIILAMGDDHGWEETGYNGHPHLKTPVLDDMAAKGLKLDNFYAAHPSCSPTRGSVMTGRHPNRYGTFTPGWSLRPEEITIAHLLKKAGYMNAHFGKWHLGPVKESGLTNPGKMGFDQWFSHDNFFELDPVLVRNGGEPKKYPGESSDIIIKDTIRFIKEAVSKGKPSFSVVWFGSPHEPYQALPEDLALYNDLPEEYSGMMARLTSNETGKKVSRPMRDVLQERYAEITAMDRSLGNLRNFLEKSGLRDNTIIWYCGDNGTPPHVQINKPIRGQKGQFYEGGIRVPGLIEWPAGIAHPRATPMSSFTSDMLPTLCAITGQELPDRPLDGISVKEMIMGKQNSRPGPMMFWDIGKSMDRGKGNHYINPKLQEGTTPLVKMLGGRYTRNFLNYHHPSIIEDDYIGNRAIINGDFKLIILNNQPALYNLKNDMKETTDISEEHPEKVAAMQKQLRSWQTNVLNSLMENDYD